MPLSSRRAAENLVWSVQNSVGMYLIGMEMRPNTDASPNGYEFISPKFLLNDPKNKLALVMFLSPSREICVLYE